MRKGLMGFVCAMAITAMSGTAYAKTVYVSAKANGNGNGSVSAPFGSISKAMMSNLEPGDVVLVKPGVYNESITIPEKNSGLPGRYITLKSEVPHAAKIVSKQRRDSMLIFANYFKVEGFDTRGGIAGKGVHHIEVRNNVSHDSPGPGIYFGASDFLLIEGNVTHSNSADAVSSGISIHIPQNVSKDNATKGFRIIVRNNVSYNNLTKTAGHTDGNGIIFDDFLLRNSLVRNGKRPEGMVPYKFPGLIENNLVYNNGGAGILVYAADNITVRNNTSYHNATDPLAKGTWKAELRNMSGSNNVWVNNIAVANPKVKDSNAISFVSFKDWPNKNVKWISNLTFNGKPGDKSIGLSTGNTAPSGNGNLFGVDPKFVKAGSDFRLKPDSPAIDAGTLQYGSSASTLGGKRVVKTIDIGVYEAGGSGTKPGKDDDFPTTSKPDKPTTGKTCTAVAKTKDAAQQKFRKTCGGQWADCDKRKSGDFICSTKKMN